MRCTRCNCYSNEYDINCIPFSGNPDAEYFFIGEMAGKNEAKASQTNPSHFIGKAGSNFDELLNIADIDRIDVAIANSHRCYKTDNKKPTETELNKCFIHTLREVNKIKPRLVIAMGSVALYQTLGKHNIERYRGKVYFSKKINCNVYTVYHPASIIYDPLKKDKLIEDFRNIKSATKPFEYYKAPYTLIKTQKEYNNIKYLLEESPVIYLDTETIGLDPWVDKLTLIQMGTSDGDIFLIHKPLINNIDLKFLETKSIIGAGFEFDAKMLSTNVNITLDNYYHDVILAEYLLTGVGKNDLTELTYKYVPECAGYDDEVKEAGGAQNAHSEMLYQYSANDVYVMYKIVKQQKIELEKEGMTWLFDKVKMPVNKILTNMSILGVKYDIDMVKKMDKKYKKIGEGLLEKAKKLKGIDECQDHFKKLFNPRSSYHIKWLLLEYYKLPVLKRTKKTKNPSVGKEEMKTYAKKHKNKYCQIMEDYRSNETLRSSFLSGVLPKLKDGIAHTKYGLRSTATGRPNSTGINLLNIPRNKDIKQCLVARDGYSFVYGDMAQMEFRAASVLYNEPRLISICNDENRDLHCNITAKAFKRDYDEIYNGYKNKDEEITELRVRGKTTGFGVLYQIGAPGLAYDLKVKEHEAQQFIDDFYAEFPDLWYNIEEIKKEVIKNGYLTNYFGFKRRWFNHSSEDHNTQRQAVNFVVQSLSFNLLEIAMIQINNKLIKKNLKSKIILQVYDSITCETIDEEIDKVAEIMKQVMTGVNKPFKNLNRVKLLVDIEVGKNLKEMNKYEGK